MSSDWSRERVGYLHTEASTQDFRLTYNNGSNVNSNGFLHFVKDIRFYSLGVIIPLGLLGNFVSILVFMTSQLRRKTAGQYFVALSIADNVVLMGELCLWMNRSSHEGRSVGADFMMVNDAVCQLVHFIRYVGRIWSSLVVMTISIERLAMIISPFNTKRYSTPTIARIIILLLLVFSASVSSPIFTYVKIRKHQEKQFCYLVQEHHAEFLVWCLAGVVTFEMIVPGIVISILTGLIIYKLTALRARRKSMQSRSPRERRSKTQTNVMLIAVALAFLVLRTPYVVSYCTYLQVVLSGNNSCDDNDCVILMAYFISYILAILNYSVNFLLYFVTGGSFRKEFYSCLKCQPTGSSRNSSGRLSIARSLSSEYQRHVIQESKTWFCC